MPNLTPERSSLRINSWGSIHEYQDATRNKKRIQFPLKGGRSLKIWYYDDFAEWKGIESVLLEWCPIKDLIEHIYDYLIDIERRHLSEIQLMDINVKLIEGEFEVESGELYNSKMAGINQDNKVSVVVTSIMDATLFELTLFTKTRTWIHELIYSVRIDPQKFLYAKYRAGKDCDTIEKWLAFVRDVMLVPNSVPLAQSAIRWGKMAVFLFVTIPKAGRVTIPMYQELKEFLASKCENIEHQRLHREWISKLTSAPPDFEELDELNVDKDSEAVKGLVEFYNEHVGR